MAYTDYEFYKNKFYGDTVPESDFLKYAERASDRIDQYTFDRLVDGLPENERAETKVQKISDGSVCNLNDTYSASYLSKYNIAVGSKFIVYKN